MGARKKKITPVWCFWIHLKYIQQLLCVLKAKEENKPRIYQVHTLHHTLCKMLEINDHHFIDREIRAQGHKASKNTSGC